MINESENNQDEQLPPIQPGEVRLEDFMKPLGLSQYRLAQDLSVAACMRIVSIFRG